MRHLFAVVFPPLAVLACGKPFQCIPNVALTLCFWLPGLPHTSGVVSSYESDRRNRALIAAFAKQRTR